MPHLTTLALHLTEALITAARAHWVLADAPTTLIAARENSVYRVDLPTGPAALRIHREEYRTVSELRSELQWMAMLADNGIPVPAPIPAADGTHLLVHGGIALDMLTWLEGSPLTAAVASEHIYFELGALVARMQSYADVWTPPPNFTRPTWDLQGGDPTWGRFWENPELTTEQVKLFIRFRDHAANAITRLPSPDVGLIHADLVPDNVLLHGGQLQPIDFDDGGFGYRLFDLATVTFRSRRTDPTGALARAVIAGYASERSVGLDALPLFEALRACSYVGWNIARMAEGEGQERNTRFIRAAIVAVKIVLSD